MKKAYRRKTAKVIKWGIPAVFAVCLSIGVIYLFGAAFSEKVLFFLLRSMRLWACLLLFLSLGGIGSNIYRLVRFRYPRSISGLALCLLSGAAAAFFLFFDSFIVTFAGGSG